jgi:hypothetical protein
MRRFLVLFIAAGFTLCAQVVSFGVKAGVPVTDALPYNFDGFHLDTGRWTVGPTAEFHLPARISIEIDGLYRGYRTISSFPVGIAGSPYLIESHNDVKAWDFPLLLKYRILGGPTRPFVDAGYQLTHESSDVTTTCVSTGGVCNLLLVHPTQSSLNRTGPAAGGGIEFKAGKIRLAPEVRYVHLNKPGTNQVTILFGVTF